MQKKSLEVEIAKQMLVQRMDSREVNDYIFMKLGTTYDVDGNAMDGYDTIEAYMRNCDENGLGYTWFSTESLHFGMAKKKVSYYNLKQVISNSQFHFGYVYLPEDQEGGL